MTSLDSAGPPPVLPPFAPLPAFVPFPSELRGRNGRASFTGRAGTFIWLLVSGVFLQLVTFGFYRFWLVTDLRRHLWSNTSVDGDALEYTGRGRELLIGFLFALAILGPVFFAYYFISIEAERLKAFLSLPLYLFFYLFGQFATYRARRYRLTRTIWRGVRFWMAGSGWKYAFRAFGWGFLVFLSLGLALPWREASMERYKMQHTYYGDLQGSFVGTGWQFFKRGWWIWVLGLLLLASYIVVAGMGVAATENFGAKKAEMQGIAAVAFAVFGIFLLFTPLFYAKFKAIEMQWWAGGIRFGDLAIKSTLRGRSLLWLYVKLAFFLNITAFALATLLFAVGYAALKALDPATLELFGSNSRELQRQLATGNFSIPLLVTGGVAYLLMLLALGTVQRFFLQRDFWRLAVNSISLTHLEAADAVAAKGNAVSGLGEGLADGLDVAGF